jgi:hypothetical protein
MNESFLGARTTDHVDLKLHQTNPSRMAGLAIHTFPTHLDRQTRQIFERSGRDEDYKTGDS